MKTTRYFDEEVLRKRPEIDIERRIGVVAEPIRRAVQPDGSHPVLGDVQRPGEDDPRALRVVALEHDEAIPQRVLRPSLQEGRTVKLHHDPETDGLHIEMRPGPSVDTREVRDGLRMDLDAEGEIVGFDIDDASVDLDLSTLEATGLPPPPRVA